MSTYNCGNLHTGQHVLSAARGFLGYAIAICQAKFRVLWARVRSHAGTLVAEKWIKSWYDAGYMNVRPQHIRLLTVHHNPERWWVFEALAEGLWLTPLDEHLRNGERLKIREVPVDYPPIAPPQWKDNLASFVARASGVWRYNYWQVLDNFGYELFGAPSLDPEWYTTWSERRLLAHVVRLMCSAGNAFISLRFRGVKPCPKLAVRATAPDDLDAGPPKCILVTVCEELKLVEAAP